MSKKKNLIKQIKNNLKERRASLIKELDAAYKQRREFEPGTENFLSICEKIDSKISQISLIDDDLSRKDKKSDRISWKDETFKPSKRSAAREASIVDSDAYKEFKSSSMLTANGPKALWLKPGILVKTKDRTLPGIVVDLFGKYATVLFGGMEVNIRQLALRPAEWDS